MVMLGQECKSFTAPKRGAKVIEWYRAACEALNSLPVWNDGFEVIHKSQWAIKINTQMGQIVIHKK